MTIKPMLIRMIWVSIVFNAPVHGKTAPSIYDADHCLVDGHCAAWKYCKVVPTTLGGVCTPRKPNGEACTRVRECRYGAYCAPVDLDRQWKGHACAPQARFGQRCAGSVDSCIRGLHCRDGKCKTAGAARFGQACEPDGTDCANGFFCRANELQVGKHTCSREVALGGPCNGTHSTECANGYCSGLSRDRGTCAALVKRNEPCEDFRQCVGWNAVRYSRNPVVCNRPQDGKTGVCGRPSNLLSLGRACSTARDSCDVQRNLECRQLRRSRQNYCQTRHGFAGSFCQQGSVYSRCDRRLVCRTMRDVPRLRFLSAAEASNVTLCLPRPIRVFAGQPCVVERYTCSGATSCRLVPGVKGGRQAAYCVRALKLGSKCGGASKFVALCEDDAACKDGICVKKNLDEVKATHAGAGASCKELPCARGLMCKNGTCIGGYMFSN